MKLIPWLQMLESRFVSVRPPRWSSRRNASRRFRSCLPVSAEVLEDRTLLSTLPGQLDPTFGDDGRILIPRQEVPLHADDLYPNAVALNQSDGSLILVGSSRTTNVYGSSSSFDSQFVSMVKVHADGTRDESFGEGGQVLLPDFTIQDAVQQADGKILVAGSDGKPAVARFNLDGTLDATFGEGGIQELDLGNVTIVSIALGEEGSIVVAGNSYQSNNYDFAVARLDSQGAMDSTFGTNGLATAGTPNRDTVGAVAVLDDGRIAIGGQTNLGYINNTQTYDLAFALFDADGNLDSSFSGDGFLQIDLKSSIEDVRALSITGEAENQRLVAGGRRWIDGTSDSADFLALKIDLNGQLDTTFGNGGWASYDRTGGYDYANDLIVLDDGSLLLGGYSADSSLDFAVLKIDAHGVPDGNFGSSGWSTLDISGSSDVANAMTALPDGSVLLGGYVYTGNFPARYDYAVAKFSSEGVVDESFGNRGFAVADVTLPGFFQGFGRAVTIDADDGSALVVGEVRRNFSGQGGQYVGIAKLQADGVLDVSFGEEGTRLVLPGFRLWAATGQPDGKIVLAGTFGGEFAIARLNANGTVDEGFGENGVVTFTFTSTDDAARYAYATSVAVAGDGTIVAAGGTFRNHSHIDADVYVARVLPDGTPDESFDGDGQKTISLSTNDEMTYAVAIDSDGRILLAGAQTTANDQNLLMIRLNRDGSLDEMFDGDGWRTYGDGDRQQANAVVLLDDGSIIAAGYTVPPYPNPAYNDEDMLIVKFTATGNLDGSFGSGGVTVIDETDLTATDLTLLGDGSFFVSGTASSRFAAIKLTSQGSIDSSFGGGLVTLDSGNTSYSAANAVRSDGSLLLAGWKSPTLRAGGYDIALAQFRPDGTLDTEFGYQGTTVVSFTGGVLLKEFPQDVQVLPDGRTVALSLEYNPVQGGFNRSTVLRRFLPDGSSDATFGDGGRVSFDSYSAFDFTFEPSEMTLQADGGIILAGIYGSSNRGTDSSDWGVIRFDADGHLDTAFGEGGIRSISLDDTNIFGARITGVEIASDGSIVIGGSDTLSNSSGDVAFALAKLTPNGDLDTNFGTEGKVLIDPTTRLLNEGAMALGADGSIYLSGREYLGNGTYRIGVAKFDANGNLATDYGSGAWATSPNSGTSLDNNFDLTIDGAGRVVLGYTDRTSGYAVGLVRFNADGSLDGTFDGDGVATFNVAERNSALFALTMERSGAILTAGWTLDDLGRTVATVMRVTEDGSLDASFADQGVATANFEGFSSIFYGIDTANDGGVVVVGRQITYEGTDELVLARFVLGNLPPAANAGGLYAVAEEGMVQLTAALTTDDQQEAGTLTYEWDLDGDGVFGEIGNTALRGNEVGIAPVFWAHGLAGSSSYTVSLRVTDQSGLAGTATSTVEVLAVSDQSEFHVTNTNDAGLGSLRQAILNANADPGAETIMFNIGTTDYGFTDIDGDGQGDVFVIRPLSPLPALHDTTGGTMIDGFSQKSYTGDDNSLGPSVVLDGALAGNSSGLRITSDNNAVFGINIHSFLGSGIEIDGGDSNWIAANYIGTDPTGRFSQGNGGSGLGNGEYGVYILEGAKRNIIGTNGDGVGDVQERNIISGNRVHGIRIFGSGTDGNVIAGNYLGVAVDGATDLGNGSSGVAIVGGARLNVIGTNGDGISDTLERNIISGNDEWGAIIRGSHDNTVAGNYIGTDAAGNVSRGNGTNGVQIDGGSLGNWIGTNGDGQGDEAERNIISGNHSGGVVIAGTGTDSNVVTGNYLGVDATGLAALGNQSNGLRISGGARFNRVGTNGNGIGDSVERNIISSNRLFGLQIAGAGTNENVVAGNYIGTTADGTSALGNNFAGVRIEAGAAGNRIGTNGTSVDPLAERNVISGNENGNGVVIVGAGTDRNIVAGNFIGVDATGMAALGNQTNGVRVSGGAQFNRVGTNGDGDGDEAERNVIAGNGNGNGVVISGVGTDQNTVAGNFIGTNSSGTDVISNGGYGVLLDGGSQRNILGTNGDGQGDEAERNIISGNNWDGIFITSVDTDENIIAGNYLGTDVTGTLDLGNGWAGIRIGSGLKNRIGTDGNGVSDSLERNVVSGNGGNGILLSGAGTTETIVAGNYIGVDATGTTALGNAQHGLSISGGSQFNRIGTNGDGSGDAGEGNVISGNNWNGVSLAAGADSNILAGNFIGTNAEGTAAVPNTWRGLVVRSANNRIGTNGDGDSDAQEKNLISGNSGSSGIMLDGLEARQNILAGNFIGTDRAGTTAIGNNEGIQLVNGANANWIGGTESDSQRNLISGNASNGISLTNAHNNFIVGNLIGTDITTLNPLPNFLGVRIQAGASNNQIGASSSGFAIDHGNIIAFQTDMGIRVIDAESVGNSIRGNSIYSNGGLGIDLANTGVTLNDADDTDTGPNNLQNFPVLDPVHYDEGTFTLTGHLDSLADTQFVLDFYANDVADSTGYGEGRRWLGSLAVMANEVFAFPLGTSVTWNEWITVTATAPDGSTSEFSKAVEVNASPSAIINGPSTVLEGGSILLDGLASSDPNQEASTLLYEWDFDYDDGLTFAVDATGPTPTFDASLLDGPSTRTVAVRVTDAGGLTDIASASIIIENVPPTAGIAGPEQAFAGESLAFALNASDPSLADETAGFTFQIDWNGDNVVDQVVNSGDSLVVEHRFDQAGAFTVRLTATDKDGGTSEVALHQILIIQPVQIDVRDMVNLQSQGLLMVTVFSTSDFDATRIDISTVLFAGASALHHHYEDADQDGNLDLVLRFRTQDTNLREIYEQLLADDINNDGELDSNKQEAEVILAGQTLDEIFIEGGDQMNLLLAGRALRDLLEDMASRGVI